MSKDVPKKLCAIQLITGEWWNFSTCEYQQYFTPACLWDSSTIRNFMEIHHNSKLRHFNLIETGDED